MKSYIVFALFGIIAVTALPYEDYRPRRFYPQQAMMFSGYYGRQNPTYHPQGAMTAYASRDTVATNTYMANHDPSQISHYPSEMSQPSYMGEGPTYMEIPSEESLEENVQIKKRPIVKPEITEETYNESNQEENDTDTATTPTTTTKSPKINKRKQKPPTRPVYKGEDSEEEEDESASWPFQSGSGRKSVPNYNAFFPMMFGGGGGGSKSRSGDSGYPGSATAIANSFSTGKGGVASSHATAYGDPSLSMLLRNGANAGFRKRNNPKDDE